MNVRLLRLALVGLLSIAVFGAAAQAPRANRFVSVDPNVMRVAKLPPGLDTTPVKVVVLLAGQPVALVEESAGRKLSRSEKDAVKSQRKNDQAAISSQIVAAGGTILDSFQSALNGIKVQIAANKVNALRSIPGVVDVKGVNSYDRDNVIGVPRVQAPAVWSGIPGFRGEGIKIAVIDTGIDYTHANFRGPGTVAAYQAAKATDTLPANPALFGPSAPRVKGGTDLVGDDYDADPNNSTYQPVPHPDPNPLDCDLDVGHGSHTAGTAAGSGVLSTGTTYHRPVRCDTPTPIRSASAPASRRLPTSTRCASSAALARPTSSSTRSTGRSTTTWT